MAKMIERYDIEPRRRGATSTPDVFRRGVKPDEVGGFCVELSSRPSKHFRLRYATARNLALHGRLQLTLGQARDTVFRQGASGRWMESDLVELPTPRTDAGEASRGRPPAGSNVAYRMA